MPHRYQTGKTMRFCPLMKVDSTDLKILAVLQQNGKSKNVEIARRISLSTASALRHTQALCKHGVIHGFHARLDSNKLGFSVTAYLLISLVSQARHELEQFERKMARWPNVRECYALSGSSDYLLKCVFRSADELDSFIVTKLSRLDNVGSTKSLLVVRTSKDSPGIPSLDGGAFRSPR